MNYFKEISLMFDPDNIYEGGFFVMIGKKPNPSRFYKGSTVKRQGEEK